MCYLIIWFGFKLIYSSSWELHSAHFQGMEGLLGQGAVGPEEVESASPAGGPRGASHPQPGAYPVPGARPHHHHSTPPVRHFQPRPPPPPPPPPPARTMAATMAAACAAPCAARLAGRAAPAPAAAPALGLPRLCRWRFCAGEALNLVCGSGWAERGDAEWGWWAGLPGRCRAGQHALPCRATPGAPCGRRRPWRSSSWQERAPRSADTPL